MEIEIEKNKLIKHLNNVLPAIGTNTFLKSLQGMKIVVSESNVKFFTSNGSLSIKEVIEENSKMKIIEPGTILVPGKIFINIIKNLKGNIKICTKNDNLKISNENFESYINLLNIEDYVIDSFELYGTDNFDIEVSKFKKLVDDVSYAASDFETNKIVLNGVNLSSYNGFLTVSATNKYRLAYESIEINSNIDFNINILKTNLKHLIPQKAEGTIKFNVDESKILIRSDQTTIMSRLIDGVFPDIKKLIPSSYSKVLKIDSKAFVKVMDQSTVLSDETKKNVRIKIDGNSMKIESRKKEVGSTEVSFSNFEYIGEPIEITFNYIYLRQALSNVSGKIKVLFNDSNSIFSVEGEISEDYKQLILPLRSF